MFFLGYTGFNLVLLCFSSVLLGYTGFYWFFKWVFLVILVDFELL